jgi:hypothetical protein
MKILTFTIGDGTVTCEASGFTGSACEVASKEFEQALGGQVTARTKKAEYAQPARVVTGNKATQK